MNFYEFTPIISVTVVVSRIISISPFIWLCLSISSSSLLKWLQINSSPGGLLHLTALKLVSIYIYVHWNCRLIYVQLIIKSKIGTLIRLEPNKQAKVFIIYYCNKYCECQIVIRVMSNMWFFSNFCFVKFF
uniref:Uncharacterized protein n=1 Tax=Heterorhabditis bacteriophora TaxID=37862 RepID=A0A1I7WZ55_HETBA